MLGPFQTDNPPSEFEDDDDDVEGHPQVIHKEIVCTIPLHLERTPPLPPDLIVGHIRQAVEKVESKYQVCYEQNEGDDEPDVEGVLAIGCPAGGEVGDECPESPKVEEHGHGHTAGEGLVKERSQSLAKPVHAVLEAPAATLAVLGKTLAAAISTFCETFAALITAFATLRADLVTSLCHVLAWCEYCFA